MGSFAIIGNTSKWNCLTGNTCWFILCRWLPWYLEGSTTVKSKLVCRLAQVFLSAILISQVSLDMLSSTCTGSDPCNACKNCHYCKHCAKEGGKCGVCK
jgi:hypothetical protein